MFGEMSLSIRPAAKPWREGREAGLISRQGNGRRISTVDRR